MTDSLYSQVFAQALEGTNEAIVVLTTKSHTVNGNLSSLCATLTELGKKQHTILLPSQEPVLEEIIPLFPQIRQINPCCLIAMGGGSAIDTAKAMGVLFDLSESEVFSVFDNSTPIDHSNIPVIALPTTAGTGAEVSKGAIVYSKNRHRKGGIRGFGLVPHVAVLCPSLLESLPLDRLSLSAFDAFTHLFESYLSSQATIASQTISLSGIRIILGVYEGGGLTDPSTSDREALLYAAYLGGLNLYHVGTCLPHRIQYPIGSFTMTEHAAGLAALYPYWLSIFSQTAIGRMKQMSAELSFPSVESFGQIISGLIESLPPVVDSVRRSLQGKSLRHFIEKNIEGPLDRDPSFSPETLSILLDRITGE